MPFAEYRDIVRRLIEGRRFIVAVGTLVPGTKHAERLLDLGAERCFVIADTRGAGDVAEHDAIEHVVLGCEAPDLMSSIRVFEEALAGLPDHVRRMLHAFDPECRAIAVTAHFSGLEVIAGRRVLGIRDPAWIALEDKVVIDDVWDAAGIARASSAIVAPRRETLVDAAQRLDRGMGTCWAGDATEGMNGGATYLRWIRPDAAGGVDDVDEAAAFFAEHCRRVRVMPFLDGIPCSIHGIVLPDAVIALRPVEMLVFRRPGRSDFLYAGPASFWDPAPDDRVVMRDTAKTVGETLRRDYGYRGGFTVDGVMTADGFRPTELNARLGAGVSCLGCGFPELPLLIMDELIRDDVDLALDAAALELLVVESADAHRGGSGGTLLSRRVKQGVEHELVKTGNSLRIATSDDEASVGTLVLGSSAIGGIVRFVAHTEHTPVGPSMAPRMAAAFAVADECFNADIGVLEPAPDLRR